MDNLIVQSDSKESLINILSLFYVALTVAIIAPCPVEATEKDYQLYRIVEICRRHIKPFFGR